MTPRTRLTEAAAAASCLCAFVLAACGGGADAAAGATSANGSASVLAARSDVAVASPVSRLFVPDLAHAAIDVADTLEPEPGGAFATSSVGTPGAVGDNLQFDPARGELYAIAGGAVVVYDAAGVLAPTARPSRRIALPASLRAPRALYLDLANDLLYVGGDTASGAGEILVYGSAHTATGTARDPDRLMIVDGGVSFFTMDPLRRRLYVVGAIAGVHVFANADTADGALVETATIPVVGTGLALDAARDRLYVADPFVGLILVDAASTAVPVVTATLSIDDARYVAVDAAADRAYVSAPAGLYVIDNASELTAATVLDAPALPPVAGASPGTASMR